MNRRSLLLAFLLALLFASVACAEEKAILFHEDFSTLDKWEPYYFPKIKSHTTYTIERDNDRHYLKAESHASASALVFKEPFNVYDFPNVKWRWKVSTVYVKGDTGTKAGDDYPIRVYIMFEFDPEQAGMFQKMKYGLAKKIYGAYPPHSSLNYVWANREQPETIVTSPFTDRAKMVLLRKGAQNVGAWQNEEVNILEDYQKAFGVKPPPNARIAVMNDSDNTGESSVSYMEYIEVYK